MKKIFKLLVVAVATLSFASCELDYYPISAIPFEEGTPLIQTADDVDAYEAGIYINLRGIWGGAYDIADDIMFDGFNATRNYGNRYGGIHRTDSGFTPGDEYVTSFWANNYSAIKDYNIVIENAAIAPAEIKEEASFIAGEARLARAISYLRLARRFGNAYNASTAATDLCVPLVLKYDQQERPARANVKAVYDQIKIDLDSAAVALADVAGEPASQYFTIDVVNAMYANYYLDVKDYEKAYEYANGIIASKVYTLCATKDELAALYTTDLGTEPILQLFCNAKQLSNGYGEYCNYGSDSNSPTGDKYASGYIPSKALIDSYEATDIRRQCWFNNCSNVPFECGGVFSQNKFYIFTKYEGNSALSSSSNPDGHVAPKVFTLPEMHLIAAEAAFNAGKKLQALSALTTLQSARKAKSTTSITIEAIQKEWFKETVGEGKRLECLKRWGIGFSGREAQTGASASGDNVVMTGAGFEVKVFANDDFHFNWPIPSYEMKVNPNLVQNPGYSSVEVNE